MKRFQDSSYSNISRLIGFYIDKKNNIYNEEHKYINPLSYDKNLGKFKLYNNEKDYASTIIADYIYLINNYYFKEKSISYDYCIFCVPDLLYSISKTNIKMYF